MSRNSCDRITSFLAMTILERAEELARQGKKVVHLEIGQPDFTSPQCVLDAVAAAARDGKTGYTHSMGILPLREAICEYYEREYGITNLTPDRILIGNGTSPAMLTLFMAIAGRGDKILMANPCYACYANFALICGAEPVYVETSPHDGFQFKPEDVQRLLAPNVRAIVLNSPSNPAGTVMPREDMRRICEMCAENGTIVISDEIYHGLVYEGAPATALEFLDEACICDGFSKRYAMTGLRLGWIVLPPWLVPVMQRLQQNFHVCANSLTQWGGLAALTQGAEDAKRMRDEYNRRRQVLVPRLNELGLKVAGEPVGAFYAIADARHLGSDSLALAFDIMDTVGVGVTPGVDFGSNSEGFLRFSYANSLENIEEGLDRLARYIEMRQGEKRAAG